VITSKAGSLESALKRSGSSVLIAQTPSGFKGNLSNQSQLLRAIKQQNAVIDSMQLYYAATPKH
jgi:hypothetical protein